MAGIFNLWFLWYPIETEPVEIQPTFAHIRIRHEMLRQVEKSNLKLRRTFIVLQRGQYIRRSTGEKNNRITT